MGLPTGPGATGLPWALERREGVLHLVRCDRTSEVAIAVDLERGPLRRRLQTARRDQPLPRAVGLHRRRPRVVDATAGLGRDALVLAVLGSPVVAVERHPVVAALVADGLARASREDLLTLVVDDARHYLDGLAAADHPDVVYLDPMYPDHGSAAVKKEMQICRELLGPPAPDTEELFAIARRVARERVVVKRSPRSEPLIDAPPDLEVRSGRLRFDVYLTR